MTERKPAGVPFETWVDRQIREATERGEFDNIPGQGKPIKDLDKPYDAVWATRHLEHEGASVGGVLPASLQLRRRIEGLRTDVRELHREDQVRAVVATLNERILAHLRRPEGPPVVVRPVNADEIVEQWRADRAADLDAIGPASGESASASSASDQPQRRRWWHRFRRHG